eukprot:CAMPEP_0197319378 /NCGR_PEP_ID=MMETSP0891-20130614/54604_1 /TAXON_ID=44058 ORGANISM="Aureoumbra lagunensis, Strain CCMP1510" /NCGR_SAMPLE_ID=MMETSP0891 /ASSEMBLY_ACC=CAM_ASM_000534 /LENGTH=84 /DNA_ID=CAMNT_0042810279 /DNA_START=34 /DNA_END=285 /DNA_ORIENTATION=+
MTTKPSTTSRVKVGRRGVLHWGETLNNVFMITSGSAGGNERLALAQRVQERPDDPGVWAAVLEHASTERSGTSAAALCKLYRRA